MVRAVAAVDCFFWIVFFGCCSLSTSVFPIVSPFSSATLSAIFSSPPPSLSLSPSATFLGALELTSRTLYPFIAAALIIFFIPTIGIATRAILKVTKQESAAKKAGDSAEQDDDTRRKCNKLLRLGKEFHQALKLKYHIIFPIITAVLTSIVVHTAVTAPSSLITIHTFRALFGTISKCGLAYLLHHQWIAVATDNMETRFNKITTHRVVTGILAVWIVSCVVNFASRASHELAPTMNKTTSVGKADDDNDDDPTYFDAALVIQTVMECLMLLSLAWWIPHDIVTNYEKKILAKRNRWPMRVAFGFVILNSLVFTCLDATTREQNSFSVEDDAGTTSSSTSSLPAYLIPIIIAVVAMSIAAKIDKPGMSTQSWFLHLLFF